ncbi:hypothetical protein IAT40_001015 [Kwoniella sp. CBS 6097]
MSYPYIGGPGAGPSLATTPTTAGPSSQPYSRPPPPPPHMHTSFSSSASPYLGTGTGTLQPSSGPSSGQQVIMGWNGYGPSSNGTWGQWEMNSNNESAYGHGQMTSSHQPPQTTYPIPGSTSYEQEQTNGYGAQIYGQKSEQESGYMSQNGVSDYSSQNGNGVEGSPVHKKHFDTAFAAPGINLGTGDRFSQLLEAKMNMLSGNSNDSGSQTAIVDDSQPSSSSSAFDYRTYSSYTMPTSSSTTGPQMSVTTSYAPPPPLPSTSVSSAPFQMSAVFAPPMTDFLGRADLYNSGPPPPPDPIQAQAQAQAMSIGSIRYAEMVAFSGRATTTASTTTNVEAPGFPPQASGPTSNQAEWMPTPLQFSVAPPPPPQIQEASSAGHQPNVQAPRLHQISSPSHHLPHPGQHMSPAATAGSALEQPRSYEPSMVDRRLHDPSATHIQPDLVAPLPSEVSYYKSRRAYPYAQNETPYAQEYGHASAAHLPDYSVGLPSRSTFPQPSKANLAYDNTRPLLPFRSASHYASQPLSSPSTDPNQPVSADLTRRSNPSPIVSNLAPSSAAAAYSSAPLTTSQPSSSRISPPSSSLIQPKSAQLPPLPSWQHAQSKNQPPVLPWDSTSTPASHSNASSKSKKQQPEIEILPPLLKIRVGGKETATATSAKGDNPSASGSRPSTPAKFSVSTSVRTSVLKDKKKSKDKSKEIQTEGETKQSSARPDKKKRKTAVEPPAANGQLLASTTATKEAEKSSAAMSASTSASSSSKKSLPEKTVIACNNCRAKKLKCNGERPKCYHCTRRGEDACTYEAILRRRGPGKNNKEKKSKDEITKSHSTDDHDGTADSSLGGLNGGGSPSASGSGSGSSSEVEEPEPGEEDHSPHRSQSRQSQGEQFSASADKNQRPSGRPNIGMGGGDRGDDSHRLKEEDIKGMEYILGNNKSGDRHGTGLGMGFGGLSMGSGSRFELSTARD